MLPDRYDFPVNIRYPDATNAHLLLENQPLLNEKDLLDDWDNRNVGLFANRRHGVDAAADCDSLDLDKLMHQSFVDYLFYLMGNGGNPDCVAFHPPPGNRNLL